MRDIPHGTANASETIESPRLQIHSKLMTYRQWAQTQSITRSAPKFNQVH